MAIQNIINAPTTPTGWTSFITNLTSTGTSPALGSGGTLTSYYLQFGKMLLLEVFLNNPANGSSGSGTYLFNIPPGFTINTAIAPAFVNSQVSGGYIGTCWMIGNVSTANNGGPGFAGVYNSTQYYLTIQYTPTPAYNFYSTGWYGMQVQSLAISCNIPIN